MTASSPVPPVRYIRRTTPYGSAVDVVSNDAREERIYTYTFATPQPVAIKSPGFFGALIAFLRMLHKPGSLRS